MFIGNIPWLLRALLIRYGPGKEELLAGIRHGVFSKRMRFLSRATGIRKIDWKMSLNQPQKVFYAFSGHTAADLCQDQKISILLSCNQLIDPIALNDLKVKDKVKGSCTHTKPDELEKLDLDLFELCTSPGNIITIMQIIQVTFTHS